MRNKTIFLILSLLILNFSSVKSLKIDAGVDSVQGKLKDKNQDTYIIAHKQSSEKKEKKEKIKIEQVDVFTLFEESVDSPFDDTSQMKDITSWSFGKEEEEKNNEDEEENEDIYTGPEYNLFAVFDGHGGSSFDYTLLSKKEWVSRYLEENFQKFVDHYLQRKCSFSSALEKSIENCEEGTLQLKQYSSTGSTVIAVMYDPLTRMLNFANVGDSQAVLFNIEGSSIRLITKEHDPFIDAEEAERVKDTGGKFYDHGCIVSYEEVIEGKIKNGYVIPYGKPKRRIQMSRVVGDADLKPQEKDNTLIATPDHYEKKAFLGDLLIIASDGFWNHLKSLVPYNLSSKEVLLAILKKHKKKSAQELAELLCNELDELVDEALEQKRYMEEKPEDDTTVIVVKFDHEDL